MEKTLWDIAVIGGGPAGMMAAGRAAERGARVILLEKNKRLGKKLSITGGGRCNITNAEFDVQRLGARYGKKGRPLFSALSRFGVADTIAFFESRGLPIIVEAENRAFPKSESAEDVCKTMERYVRDGHVVIKTNCAVREVASSNQSITHVVCTNGENIRAKQYIVTTGGKSHPETGSTGDAFVWLKKLGHTIIEPKSALVPVAVREAWVKDLMGISLPKAKVSLLLNGKPKESRIGKTLFTHFGLSGPAILNMSSTIGASLEGGQAMIAIDLFPTLDAGALDRELLRVLEANKNKRIKNALGELVPAKLQAVVLQLASIDPDTAVYRLEREKRIALVHLLKKLTLTPVHLLGEEDAIITSGGLELSEVDFASMRSKKISNLFVAGDILDFERPSGGFSLQICWTTGWLAGESVQI